MSEQDDAGKPWGGRFSEPTDELVERFTASVGFDRRLYRHDIEGSIAHARMLNRAGVLDDGEFAAIEEGLAAIRREIDEGRFVWRTGLEDVHMNIEAALTERIGEAGRKLHTARSRNDQVATAARLYAREEAGRIDALVARLQRALADVAEREADTVMPGLTHLQSAQPVTFGHHMMAWHEMLERDRGRLRDCRKRLNECPLGSAALAGTTFPIDREYTARLLGFDRPAGNSLDAVSDRDFAIELTAVAALIMTHLSRFAEDLVLWTSPQFGFVELPDRFCTGSSIMPQKKNPDVAELVRGKAARVNGRLTTLLCLMKGQPLAYNRDNQEDKEPLFDALDTTGDCLRVWADMTAAMECDRGAMLAAARRGHPTATDLADYLVRKGMPFRDAHETVGRAVRRAQERRRELAELELDELRAFSALIGPDVFDVLDPAGSAAARDHPGGTAPDRVRAAAKAARDRLDRI